MDVPITAGEGPTASVMSMKWWGAGFGLGSVSGERPAFAISGSTVFVFAVEVSVV